MRVEEILLMMRETPFGEDRAAARNDACNTLRRQRNMRQPNAGMNGEIVDALLALLHKRVAVDLPGEFFGHASDLLKRLVDRNGADGNGRIADDPFADRMDVTARREVHHGVAAPADGPDELF